jgi:hypothetical protein
MRRLNPQHLKLAQLGSVLRKSIGKQLAKIWTGTHHNPFSLNPGIAYLDSASRDLLDRFAHLKHHTLAHQKLSQFVDGLSGFDAQFVWAVQSAA